MTWLYGAASETAAATEQANRGHALHIRGDETGTGIQIGVVTNLNEAWSPLAECELQDGQFWTPYLDQALADLAAAREQAIAQAAEEEARREALRQAENRHRATEAARELDTRVAPQPPTIDRSDKYETLLWWAETPELASWVSKQTWTWADDLTDEGKEAARLVSYIVSRLYTSGPISMLLLPDEITGAEAVAAVERAGFLRRYARQGVERWERIDRTSVDRRRFG